MKASGRSGVIRAGGREAARLGAWRLIPAEGGGHDLQSELVWQDMFWMGRGPHQVRLRLSQREWVWRGVGVSVEGDALRAALQGEPDVEDCS